ncbi:MAG TPA: hypothetical protein VIT43_14860 [Candidatus Dormibacteraeota bacterium]
MAEKNWFYKFLDSRFKKAVDRQMMRLPMPIRFTLVFAVFLVVLVIALAIVGLINAANGYLVVTL